MKSLRASKRVISWFIIVSMLITWLPGNVVVNAEEETISLTRQITDEVQACIGDESVSMELYANGMYETKLSAVAGTASVGSATATSVTVKVNGVEKGSTSWTPGDETSIIVRYNSVTGEVTNSISNTNVIKSAATWVGKLTDLNIGLTEWNPADSNGDLEYLGGGLFAKTFHFTVTTADITLDHGGYKVAYNHDWGQGEVSDDKKVTLTVPAGTSSITVFADTNTGYITDSVNTPGIANILSLIGPVREAGDASNWEPTLSGWDMRKISKDYYIYSKVFATAGTYEYKTVSNYKDWMEGGNRSLTTTIENTKVVFLYDVANSNIYDSINDYNTIATALGFPVSGQVEIVPDTFVAQTGGAKVWRVTGSLGSYDSWNVANPTTVMKHLVGEYYAISLVLGAGTYEFKFTQNGSWDNAIGSDGISNNSANFKLTLTEKTKVNFYLNDELDDLNKVRTNLTSLEAQGMKAYEPVLSSSEWPRLVGNIQTKFGEPAWSPDLAKQMFVDYYFNNTVYKLQRTLPQGKYEAKVVFGDSWTVPNYGGPTNSTNNLVLDLIDSSANVTFSIDTVPDTKLLTHNYKPQDSIYDGIIDTGSLYFDSRSLTYKKPFGAIKQGEEDVTFRFATKSQDVQSVKLELIDYNGISATYDMMVSNVVEGKDYWEVTVAKDEFRAIGIWGYKFIIIDGSTKLEYGDDGSSGGTGAFSASGQVPYNLTVYAKDYQTPDWMKNAVVYQIFPDRFFDGDTTNNHAKDVDGVRGDKVQLFDGEQWSTIPENPRQSEEANKPYYPDASTDGVWSNEFYGGDIEGIRQKLSYLQTLGVTAIYLNPVSWAASNHKYDATDYKHLDPMFGKPVYNIANDPSSGLDYAATKAASDKVYSDFADVCNELGIYLIADGVFNHVGDDSIYFDRYEKYPEIGAYEYWSRVWKEVEGKKVSKEDAETTVKAYYKSLINPSTGKNYTDADFNYVDWFTVGPNKVGSGALERYDYEGWWGFDSLPVITATQAQDTNLSNDSNATIAGMHEYNTVDFREHVIGYDLNQENITDVQAAMEKANSQRWIWMGANGWRLDVAPDVSDGTWQQFRTAVKSTAGKIDVNGNIIADPIILGEEWNVATKYLLGDMFDSVMNYQFRAALQNFIINDADAATLHTQLEIIRENYPKEAWQAMLNLVDSHDTVRNITKIDYKTWEEENTKVAPEASDRAIKLQALTAIFQLSYPGAPTIYYGDEVGVTGTKDPDSRRTFPWERVTEKTDGSYQISSAYDAKYGDLFDSYVKAAQVRNQNQEVYASGDMKLAYANGSVIAYARKSANLGGLSVINKSDVAVEITADVKDFLPDGLVLVDQLGSKVTGTVVNGTITLQIPAYTGLMMLSTTNLSQFPTAPSNFHATAIDGATGQVNLTWDSVTGASGYHVFRASMEGMEITQLTTSPITETQYSDLAVVNGTRYYYYIKSIVDGTLSNYSEVASALPSYCITGITRPTEITIDSIGVGKKTTYTDVTITIPGLTDNATYKGLSVPTLDIRLVYYKEGTDPAAGLTTLLRYKEDVGETSKTYTAAFEPIEEGTYRYFAKATVNRAYSYQSSEETSVVASANYTKDAPAVPNLLQPIQESSRVSLNWTADSTNIEGYHLYRKQIGEGGLTYPEYHIATLGKDVTSYDDYMVSNDTTYEYRVLAFNSEYKRTSSNTITITPKLTMVEVTIRLNIPDKVFTSATDNIYIAGSANGWNASGWLLKKPSGATNSNIVEYTFPMMSGSQIQYKYTRGTWATEAFTSNQANDISSYGNYGYSSTDTNIHLTVVNQGNNKMLVNDYVLRWVDMPIMITVPRISYKGETIEYTTRDDSFNLQASVPFGGIFTINGQDINTIKAGALDQYGNVRLDNIPLNDGLNEFVLHIEPTQETLEQPWLTDKSRITSQMTATTIMRITKLGGTSEPQPTAAPTQAPTQEVTPTPGPIALGQAGTTSWKDIASKLDDTLKKYEKDLDNMEDPKEDFTPLAVAISMDSSVSVPKDIFERIQGKDVVLTLDYGSYKWEINGKDVQEGASISEFTNLGIAAVDDNKTKTAMDKAFKQAIKNNEEAKNAKAIKAFDISYDGELPFKANLIIQVDKKYRYSYIYMNYYDEVAKKLITQGYAYVDGKGNASFTFQHASIYMISTKNLKLPSVSMAKNMKAGQSYVIKTLNHLEGAQISYKTSNKYIATVDKNGKITTKKAGTVTVTVFVEQAGEMYLYKTKVTVKGKK